MDGELELMRRVASGDDAALAELYERLGRNVWALALNMLQDPEEAQEVLQDTFVKLYHNSRRFDPELGSVRAYLYTIARNEARSRLRARAARPQTVAPEDFDPPVPSGEAARLDRMTLERALGGLNRDEAELLRASFFGGFSHAELAESTGLPLGTLKSRIRRALHKLRAALGEP